MSMLYVIFLKVCYVIGTVTDTCSSVVFNPMLKRLTRIASPITDIGVHTASCSFPPQKQYVHLFLIFSLFFTVYIHKLCRILLHASVFIVLHDVSLFMFLYLSSTTSHLSFECVSFLILSVVFSQTNRTIGYTLS